MFKSDRYAASAPAGGELRLRQVFGFVVAALLAGIKAAAKSVKMPGCPAPVRMVTIGGAASMAGILVCGIADYIWNYPRVMVVFWFVFAVMLSGVKLAKKSK